MKESLKISNMDKSDLLQSPTINDNEQGNIKPLPKIKDLLRITEFNDLLKKRVLSVYDDCIKCNKEARLLQGLCFECWK